MLLVACTAVRRDIHLLVRCRLKDGIARLLLLVAKAACLQQVLDAPACVRIGRPALFVLCTWPCLVQHVVAVGR